MVQCWLVHELDIHERNLRHRQLNVADSEGSPVGLGSGKLVWRNRQWVSAILRHPAALDAALSAAGKRLAPLLKCTHPRNANVAGSIRRRGLDIQAHRVQHRASSVEIERTAGGSVKRGR